MKKFLLVAIAFLSFPILAQADSFTVNATRADQNPTDIIDWGVNVPDGTSALGPLAVSSFGLINATLSSSGNVFSGFTNGIDVFGNFDSGESLLYNNAGGAVTVAFAPGSNVQSVGFEIQDENFGPFTGELDVYNGSTLLMTLGLAGLSNQNLDGSALFMGLTDNTGANITSVVINTGSGDFLIDDVSLTTGAPTATPEPGSILLLGSGLLGLAGVRRKWNA